MTRQVWSQEVVSLIAQSVKHYRTKRGMSAEKLAQATADAGYEIPRSVIANLESGRRETISVTEWLVLGRALNVPPLLLLFPIGRVDLMEVLPGHEMSPWTALKWAELGGSISDAAVTTPRGGPIDLFREHEDAVCAWQRMQQRVRDIDDARAAETYAAAIRAIRDRLRSLDLTPPRLPPDLQYLDDEVDRS